MSAMKNFAAITGLLPFSLNRVSFIIAFSVTALVIAKLVDAYLFCGFNKNFFVDLPVGVVLFISNCFLPLLGLAVNRKPTTKRGCCCRTSAIVVVSTWFFVTCFAIMAVHLVVLVTIGCPIGLCTTANDPLNVCGSRTNETVRSQFTNATATFDIFERIDLVCKIAVTIGWFVLATFAFVAVISFLDSTEGPQHQQAQEDPEFGKPEQNDETIIWMEESDEEKIEQPSAFAEHGPIDSEDESALRDAAREAGDRMSEVGSVDLRMENLRNEINEPGSNAEPQSKEAKEPKFSNVDEEAEKEPTTSKAT